MQFSVALLAVIISSVSSSGNIVPEITVSRTADELHVSWTPVDYSYVDDVDECFIVYQFTHQLNGVSVTNVITEEPEYTVPLTPCAENIFVVTTRCRTGAVVADAVTKTYITRMHDDIRMENVAINIVDNKLEISWSRPQDSQACDISYNVKLVIGNNLLYIFNTTANVYNLGQINLAPCLELKLTVTPFDDEAFGLPETASLVMDREDAGGIKDLTVNNDRIEWRESQDNGQCEITYTIIVTDSKNNAISYTTNNTFFEIDWVICATYTIFVESRVENVPVSALHATHRPRPIHVKAVEEIALQEVSGAVVLSWAPVVIGVCEVHYKLRHYINGIQVASALISETQHTFNTDFCAENTATVQPIVDMIIGQEISTDLISSSAEPEPVGNLIISKNPESLFVSWAPVNVGFCDITYRIEHIVNGELIESSTVTSNSIYLDRISCSSNEVRVTPVAGTLEGISSSQSIEISLESLDPVKEMSVIEIEDGLLVSWSPIVKGLCEITYKLSNFDGESTTIYETNLTSYVVRRSTCANNTVSIQGAEVTTGIVSEISHTFVEVDIDLTKVRNMTIISLGNSFYIQWMRPEDSYHCSISFIGSVVTETDLALGFETEDTSAEVEVDIIPCERYDIVVIPVSPAGVHGVPLSKQYTSHLTYLNPVTYLQTNETALSWERPLNTGVCPLTYVIDIVPRSGDQIRKYSQIPVLEIEMTPCETYVFAVQVLDGFTNLTSTATSIVEIGTARILQGPSAIEYNLDREILSVTWNPTNAGLCSVAYNVVQTIDDVEQTVNINQPSVNLTTVSCSENRIVITPIMLQFGIIGESIYRDISVGLEEIGPVRNITVSGNAISWNAPEFSGNCELTYVLNISTSDVVKTLSTQSLYAEVELIPCEAYDLRITPNFDFRIGDYKEVAFTADEAAHSAPEHIRSIPSLASAVITLQANPIGENNCDLTNVRILCNDSNYETLDRILPIIDSPTRKFNIILTDLTFNTHYTCAAQWLPNESELSEPFTFYTRDIPLKTLEILNVTSDDITISWEELEGLGRYVLYYVIVITSVGPNHFVQESCDIERNYTRLINVPAEEFTFTFTDALANYKYHISLITRYSIGLDSDTEISIVNTPPSVPGPITDLEVIFDQETCEVYSADGVFTWTPPCDINGPLDRFEVQLTTYFEVGRIKREEQDDSTLLALFTDINYNFVLKIPTVNPFFNYTISIKTVAAYVGETPNELTVTPPTAYAYCGV